MKLPATTPSISPNLLNLARTFTPDQARALEDIFRTLTTNLNAMQKLIAQVVNANADIQSTSESLFKSITAGVSLGGNRVVYIDGAGQAQYAANDDLDLANVVLGITTGAVSSAASGEIQTFGTMNEPSWTWTPEQPVYLGVNGLMTQVPTAVPGTFILIVGIAVSATQLFINFKDPVVIS